MSYLQRIEKNKLGIIASITHSLNNSGRGGVSELQLYEIVAAQVVIPSYGSLANL